MSRSAEPALGDSVIGHDPETAQAYRLAAQEAARRQASSLPPAGSRRRRRPGGASRAAAPHGQCRQGPRRPGEIRRAA